MQKLHITQDEAGYWMMSLEEEDGSLKLLAHRFLSPEHLVEDAHDLVKDGVYPGATVVVDVASPQKKPACRNYCRPNPRKAGQ